jgi:hypothetical protein
MIKITGDIKKHAEPYPRFWGKCSPVPDSILSFLEAEVAEAIFVTTSISYFFCSPFEAVFSSFFLTGGFGLSVGFSLSREAEPRYPLPWSVE